MSDVETVLARVLSDLSPDHADRVAVGGDTDSIDQKSRGRDLSRVARAEVEVDGRPFELRVATRGRYLLRITETTFVVPGPSWDVTEFGPVDLRVGHRGMVKRTGTDVRVRMGGEHAHRLAAVLDAAQDLDEAMLPLDFTDFTVGEEDGRLVARIVLMGASMTRFRLPPTSSYVRLFDDQREALLDTAAVLDRLWTTA